MERKEKFTEGPWVGRMDALAFQGLVYSESTGNDIAVCYDHGNVDGNTRLIAAAPDMYALLHDVMTEITSGGGDWLAVLDYKADDIRLLLDKINGE